MKRSLTTRAWILSLTFTLCGVPEMLAQSAQSLPDAPSASRLLAQNSTPATQDPSAVPTDAQQPPAPANDQPRVVPVDPQQAPGTEEQQPDAAAQDAAPKMIAPADPAELQQLESSQKKEETPTVNERINPLGTAAAEKAKTAGGGASRPAGVAIAPAKQKRSRSFLIKLGALAAAGAAVGTVYALSKGTSSTPAGAVH